MTPDSKRPATTDCCRAKSGSPALRTLNKSSVILLVIVAAIPLSFCCPRTWAWGLAITQSLRQIGWALVLGFALGGVVERFVPAEYVSKILARKSRRTVIAAAMLGFTMSACSHGILALSIQLYRKGAPPAAVVSFLLASPWANLPVTILLIGFFGLKALYLICGALAVAVLTGWIFQELEKHGWIESNPNTLPVEESFSIQKDIAARWSRRRFTLKGFIEDVRGVWRGSVGLARMVLGWVLIGIALSAVSAAYIPQEFFQRYMGPSWNGLLITLALATVMEVCSEGMAPMAFQIYRQTGAFGNAFAFLMAGVVTDYTEIGILWTNIGKRCALFLPLVTVPQVLFLAYIANKIFH